MRIAVWHNLPSGGGKRALHDHIRGLVGRGHEVEAWCPATADTTFLPLADFCREHVLPWDDRPPRPWVLTSYRAAGLATYGRMAAMDKHCRQAADAINAGNFDLLFANSCMLFRAAPIGRYVRLPSLLYLQEPYRWLYESMPDPPFIGLRLPGRSALAPWYVRAWLRNFFDTQAKRAQVRVEYESAGAFDRILVNSYYSRESVLRAYGLDAAVCYLGVDSEKFIPTGRARGDYVLGVGAFVPEKNIEFVIQAMGCVTQPRPRLVWIGNVGDLDYIERLQQLAAGVQVEFIPQRAVAEAEVITLLGDALAMAYAPRLEPFGYAPLEANACGTPVVAVAEGGVRETVRHEVNGLVVDHRPAAMAAAIERLRDDPVLAGRLAEAGRSLVCTVWSLAAATDRLEDHLRGVVKLSETRSMP
jgi:glycosyltransferase involved in cell wall biosynthesis